MIFHQGDLNLGQTSGTVSILNALSVAAELYIGDTALTNDSGTLKRNGTEVGSSGTTFSWRRTVTNATTFNSTLTVTGASTMNGALTVAGTLTASGDAYVTGDLYVDDGTLPSSYITNTINNVTSTVTADSDKNTYAGTNALSSLTTGSNNVGFGYDAIEKVQLQG